jgi:hypothetical protein
MCSNCGCNPPGNLADLTDENKKLWCKNYISRWMTGEIEADPDVVDAGRTKLTQFFNICENPGDYAKADVTWVAFPRLVQNVFSNNDTRWRVADSSRMFQDEYLEWSVHRESRNVEGDVLSVSMTCEGPEFWQFYASYQRDDCIETIKKINGTLGEKITEDSLFLKDPKTGHAVYNPNNYWNVWSTTGTITHLIQPNNTLSAEIDIAAQATVIRKDKEGNIIKDFNKLINCSGYGNPGRNSDPTIGGNINQFAIEGKSISVADPVALYIHSFDTSTFKYDLKSTTGTPRAEDLEDIDEKEAARIFQCVRGDLSKKQGLRLKIEVPKGKVGKDGKTQLNVSNLYDMKTKKHVKFGAQFADYIKIGVTAVYKDGKAADPQECYKQPSAASVDGKKKEAECQCDGPSGLVLSAGPGSRC